MQGREAQRPDTNGTPWCGRATGGPNRRPGPNQPGTPAPGGRGTEAPRPPPVRTRFNGTTAPDVLFLRLGGAEGGGPPARRSCFRKLARVSGTQFLGPFLGSESNKLRMGETSAPLAHCPPISPSPQRSQWPRRRCSFGCWAPRRSQVPKPPCPWQIGRASRYLSIRVCV